MTKQYDIESSNIEGLIPRQLINDSEALIEFLKEYYRYLNQDGGPSQIINNIIANRDLDAAVDSFVALIRKELGQAMVNDIVADKINLYKHITQFYNSRGSLDSFRILFRLLFNTEIDISLPKEKILVASDGRWVQQTSFFIEVTEGDVFALYAQIINLTNPYTDGVTTVEIERIRQVNESNVYEIYIRKSVVLSQISVGDIVNYLGVTGTVISSLNDYEIIYGGSGFKVGQYVDIVDPSVDLPAKIKVTRVSNTGAITKLEFIRFNGGYADTQQYMIVATDNIVGGVDLIASTDPDQEQIDFPDRAIIKFTSSAIALYAGSYINNKGFLSDDIYLQDNFFYQPYSYQIKSGQLFTAYKNILNQTVHPAGMIAFGAFEINNDFDLSRQLSSITRYFQSRYYEEAVDTSDQAVITFVKVVSELITTGDAHIVGYNKPTSDSVTSSEFLSYDYTKSISDSLGFNDEQIFAVDKSLTDVVYSLELLTFNVNKQLSDDINSIDSGTIELDDESYSIGYFASDYAVGTSQFN